MGNRIWNPDTVAAPFAAYSHCCEIPPGARWLTIAGQVGVTPQGDIAEGIEAQCECTFNNLLAVLAANDMGPGDLVKLGVFLTDRSQLATYRAVRARLLGDAHAPPGTLVIAAGLAHPDWLVEVEGYAAR